MIALPTKRKLPLPVINPAPVVPPRHMAFVVESDTTLLALLRRAAAQSGIDLSAMMALDAIEGPLAFREPDMLLIGQRVAGPDWPALLAAYRDRLPDTLVVLLTDPHPATDLVVQALRSGAANVFHAGQSADLVARELNWLLAHRPRAEGRRAVAARRTGATQLTARERHVLDRLASGRSNREIAAELGLSPRTIESCRARCIHKLGARNSVELISLFLGHG